jgi:phosphoglycolate phosphatase
VRLQDAEAPASIRDPGATLASAITGKRLLVLDYDGTLAYLAIDWTSVRRDLAHTALQTGFVSSFRPLWDEMARFRDEKGESKLGPLFRVIARHEEIGVDGQQPRPELVAHVQRLLVQGRVEAAVFSSNLHQTVSTGLGKLGLEAISAIVGADDITHWKPDPEGLQLLLERAAIDPNEALFVGDSRGDAHAAEAAGVEFLWV